MARNRAKKRGYVSSRHGLSREDACTLEWIRGIELKTAYQEVVSTFERFQQRPNPVRCERLVQAIARFVDLRDKWRAELESDRAHMLSQLAPKLARRVNYLDSEFAVDPDSERPGLDLTHSALARSE